MSVVHGISIYSFSKCFYPKWLTNEEYDNIKSYVAGSHINPAAQDRLPTEAKQGWAGQHLDGRPPGKTRLLLEEVLLRPAGGA